MKNYTSRLFFSVMGVAGLLMMCGPGAHAQSTAAAQKTATVQKAAPAPTTGEPMEKASADRQVVQADGSTSTVVITDWSSHHMVFSNPAKAKPAVREKIVTSPRYIMQLKRQALASRTIKFNSEADRIAAESAASQNAMNTLAANSRSGLIVGNSITIKKPTPTPAPPPAAPMAGTRDWNMSLGTGTVAAGQFPAEVTAGEATITGTGGASPTGNCLTDFVVFGLNTVGTNTQANLIAFDDLYSGTTGSPICGTTANTKWAYNTSTVSGTISNSPVTSGDGTMVAFVENNNSAAVLHILKWKDSNGTINAPVTPTTVASMSACSTTPCMASVQFTSNGDSISSPFYDFITDTMYVGDNIGFLYAITGVFYGTPTLAASGPLAGGLQVSPLFGALTAPVYDFFGSGNIFVGSADGSLYAVNATTGAIASVQAGNGAGSGAITDPPTVDSSNQRVIVSAGTNTAGASAVVLQADTTTPLGNPVSATVGTTQGSSLVAEQGAFDTGYYNWSGTGGNPGHFYVVGGTATTTAPTLYQIPFSGVASVNVSGTATGGSSNPTVSFSGGGGSGAAGVASGSIFGVTISNAGTGYTSFPTPTFTGGGGSGAAGSTSDMKVLNVTGLVGGSNYQGPTTATINGSGPGGETGTAALGIDLVTPGAQGAYTSQPTVTSFAGGGTGGAGTPVTTVQTVAVSAGGSGFTGIPTVAFAGTHTVAAAAAASVGLNGLNITSAGSGYTTVPNVNVTGGTGSGASATGALGLVLGTTAVAGGNGGSYTNVQGIPGVTFPGGTSNGVGGASVGPTSITCSAQCGSFTAVPTIAFSGTHSVTAAATALLGLNTVTVTADGSGYTGVVTVGISGGGGTGAAATATMAIGAATITAGGAYTTVGTLPTGTITGGGGSGATITSTGAVSAVTLTTGGCYGTSSTPTVAFGGTGGGTGASYTAHMGTAGSGGCTSTRRPVTSITQNSGGSGYGNVPTVSFTCTGGCTVTTAATATATVTLTAATVTADGNNYTSVPTSITFGSGGGTASATLGLGTITITAPGTGYTGAPTYSYTGGGSGSGATVTTTLKFVSANITTTGAYTQYPTATTSGGGTGATQATLTVSTVTVVSVTTTSAGTGYTAGPVAGVFSPTGATVSVPLALVGLTNIVPGSYTAVPTVGLDPCGGTGCTNASVTATYKVVSVAVSAGGSYTTFPSSSTSGGGGTTQATLATTAGVIGVNVTAAGTGYSGGPVAVNFSGSGGATATADLKVVSVALAGGGGDYTSVPTVSFTDATGTGATASLTLGVLAVSITSPGDGYSGTITVGFSGGGGTGAAGSATIAVDNVQLTYGGGGYSTPPTVTISGASGITATATVNPGNVITAGTSPNKLAVSATAGVQTSPISDVFNTATNSDTLFYGFGTVATPTDIAEVSISAAGVLGATQTLAAEPASIGASSGIVVDPFTSGTNNQANSIYFATQGSASTDSGGITKITAPGTLFSGNDTVTVTMGSAEDFASGDTVVVSGVTCTGILCGSLSFNGTWVITVTNSTTFTYVACTGALCGSGTETGSVASPVGTATDNGLNNAKVSFKAVKLTQAGLQ
jgi:hypothetical protein